MRTFRPPAGMHISLAAVETTELSRAIRKPVKFAFNGVRLFAAPKKSPRTIEWEFEQQLGRSRSNYVESVEGQRSARVRADEIQGRQQAVDMLIQNLNHYLSGGLDLTIDWAVAFARVSDDIGVHFDHSALADKLEQAGYLNNAHVGDRSGCETSRKICGEWIMGQVVNCLRHGMPPHPMTENFAVKYRAMKEDSL